MPPKDPARRIRAALEAYQDAKDPLDQLDATIRLREAAEDLESIAVEAARKRGATWSGIGRRYGLTKQGAQQRFRSASSEPRGGSVAAGRRKSGKND